MLNVERIPISKIRPAAYNPRKDLQPGDSAYEKLKKSIIEFSNVEPIVWNKKSGNVVGGHQRLKILKDLKQEETQVSVVNLPEDKEKALNLALNKIQGEWDLPKLSELLVELDTGAFDIEITGFDEDEIKNLLVDAPEESEEEERVKDIKKGLKEGVMVVIGWYQILVRPGMPEFDKLWKFAGTKKKWSEEESQDILKKIHEII